MSSTQILLSLADTRAKNHYQWWWFTVTGNPGAGQIKHVVASGNIDPTINWANNPGFESGDVDWTKGTGFEIIQEGFSARTGSWVARRGLNKANDPGFEAGTAANWTLGSGFTVVNNAANAHSGNYFLARNSTNGSTDTVFNDVIISVSPGQTIYLSGWVFRTPAADGTGGVRIRWEDSNGIFLSNTTQAISPAASTWTRVTLTGTAPANAAKAKVAFVQIGQTTGTWRFDDMLALGTDSQGNAALRNSKLIPVSGSDKVYVEAYVKSLDVTAGTGGVRVSWTNNLGVEQAVTSVNLISPPGDTWTKVSGTASRPNNSSITHARIEGVVLGQNTGVWYMEDFTYNVLDHEGTVVTLDSALSVLPNDSSTYELKEWRFFNGSESGAPYPGIAILQFKKRIGERGRYDDIFADINGLPASSRVRALQSILVNSTWGYGLSIDTASFDAAHAESMIQAVLFEGGINKRTDSGDVIESILEFPEMSLHKDSTGIRLEYDKAKSSVAVLGFADGFYENIVRIESTGLMHIHTNQKTKNLAVKYRRKYSEDNTYLGFQQGQVNARGVDKTIILPWTYDPVSANRELYYLIKRTAAKSKQLKIVADKEASALVPRQAVTIKIPSLAIDAVYEINAVTKSGEEYILDLFPYDGSAYTYSQIGDLDIPPSAGIDPDFEHTHPDPCSSFNVAMGFDIDTDGTVRSYGDFTWIPPDDGNYEEAVISAKLVGQHSALYQELTKGFDQARGFLTAGLSYDFKLESKNKAGLKSTAVYLFNKLAPGDTTPPAIPNNNVAPTLTAILRNFTAVLDNEPEDPVEPDFWRFDWEVADSGGNRIGKLRRTQNPVLEWTEEGVLSVSRKVRARKVDRSKNKSGWTPFSNVVSAGNSYGIQSFLNTALIVTPLGVWTEVASVSITTGGGPIVVMFSCVTEPTNEAGTTKNWDVRLKRNGAVLSGRTWGRFTTSDMISKEIRETVAAGNYTYSLEVKAVVFGGSDTGVSNRDMIVREDKV